jgi:HK97 family phage prohead protease
MPETMHHKATEARTLSVKEADGDLGLVEAIVSVTNIVDHDNDVIEPGAYKETLEARQTVVCWGHDKNAYCGKIVQAEELMPGDARLPADLLGKGAGALLVTAEFNLKSTRGRDAFYDVQHRGSDQEWSIGWAAKRSDLVRDKAGVQRIKALKLYEVSPVLAGASPGTRTGQTKDDKAYAQVTGSFEETRDRVQQALQALARALYPPPSYAYAWIEATFSDRVIANIDATGLQGINYVEVDYTLNDDGTITLGTPVPVDIEATVVPKSEDLFLAQKEGRVLSTANMRALAAARQTINSVSPPPATPTTRATMARARRRKRWTRRPPTSSMSPEKLRPLTITRPR